ncbi:ROK family transcriptional regulator [Ruegeria hyattellae]|uniref:ROK family transcriptional regulator n=1 Tax=Ruegeria hyattellae TaxID=3233337 RepID=UPI00355B0B6F
MTTSTIVQAIITYGPVSRASVAKMTGFSKQTVSEVVSTLETDGWVQTVGRTEGNIGRRAVVYEIVPDAAYVAGVDLGGTKVRVALCNLSGAVVSEITEPTNPAGGTDVVGQISKLVVEAAARNDLPTEKIRVAVIGVPGVLEPDTGHIRMSPNIADVDKLNFPALLEEQLGIEVIVENDVNLAALGEHWMTQRAGYDDLAFVSVGTGIGAGLVIGGELVRGATGGAGEIGFLPFGADPNEPESLAVGALERATATSAIIDLYRRETGRSVTVPEIFDASSVGDTVASEVLRCVANQIARAIVAICSVVDPSCVVLGGSIGARHELLDLVRQEIAKCFPRPIQVEPSALGVHAALAGATSVALSRLHVAVFAKGLPGTKIDVPAPELKTFQQGVA